MKFSGLAAQVLTPVFIDIHFDSMNQKQTFYVLNINLLMNFCN